MHRNSMDNPSGFESYSQTFQNFVYVPSGAPHSKKRKSTDAGAIPTTSSSTTTTTANATPSAAPARGEQVKVLNQNDFSFGGFYEPSNPFLDLEAESQFYVTKPIQPASTFNPQFFTPQLPPLPPIVHSYPTNHNLPHNVNPNVGPAVTSSGPMYSTLSPPPAAEFEQERKELQEERQRIEQERKKLEQERNEFEEEKKKFATEKRKWEETQKETGSAASLSSRPTM